MDNNCVGILMPGDMGHAVGATLIDHGRHVVTALDGRSDNSRMLAARAGMTDLGSIDAVVSEADMILAILPPAAAEGLAIEVSNSMQRTGKNPVYVDCNAVSPDTVSRIEKSITGSGGLCIDVGIVGLRPGRGAPPRFYVSGPDVSAMMALDGTGIQVVSAGDVVGQASAVKMVYAGLTKGTWTLHLSVLLAAQKMGVLDTYLKELEFSQKSALNAMRSSLPRLPADSARWVGEMEQIAETLGSAGLPSGIHEGAADIFRILARTPFASETRETIDRDRTLEDALGVYGDHIDPT